LVTAASMLAGAQLISRRAAPMVGSFSIPGLVAAGVGVLTWQRLVARRKAQQTWVTRARKAVEVARH
jgi:ubiquinone biosynthesis protein